MKHKKDKVLPYGMDVESNVSQAKSSTAKNAFENFCGYFLTFSLKFAANI
jgi:hypothetical protein